MVSSGMFNFLMPFLCWPTSKANVWLNGPVLAYVDTDLRAYHLCDDLFPIDTAFQSVTLKPAGRLHPDGGRVANPGVAELQSGHGGFLFQLLILLRVAFVKAAISLHMRSMLQIGQSHGREMLLFFA